jgi:hypothetical protein
MKPMGSIGFGKRPGSAVTLLTTALCAPFAPAQTPSTIEEIIVRGRSYAELREQIRIRQDAVFARFNEINSDDAFDIHCKMEPAFGSRILERRCLSNVWRELDANFGRAWQSQVTGLLGPAAGEYRAEQQRSQALLKEQMRRLAHDDPALGEAVLQLGQAMQALQLRAGVRPSWTMFREVAADGEPLAFTAERIFEIQIGLAPWTHYLTYPTFTLDAVSGRIRKIEVECEQGSRSVEYEADVEWSVPRDWNRCELRVRATRGATFTFYEFQ